ncbi:MAG: type II secretion system protein [Candidatus Levybacteria bacterium]|nr:type II secretion system protein [Candidatus Levybacteria bacterium]
MTTARKTLQKGFTLIELLVVIGILGILATALIATIDPFEQLKKAQDSNVKNSMVEYLNANLRYFTTHNGMPWADTANAGGGYAGCSGNDGSASADTLGGAGSTCVNALVADGELKPTYTTATNITKEIVVFGNSNTITACYQPQSKSGQRDINTHYDATGVSVAGCISETSSTGATNCYYCAQL